MGTRAIEQVKSAPEELPEQLGDLSADAFDAGKEVSRHPWVGRMARLGYVARGLLYAMTGVLALQVASGAGDRETDQQGALRALATSPLGSALLVAMAVGLAGYALWGFVRAIFDPLGKGTESKGLAQRGGFLVSGIAHASLLVGAVRLLAGGAGSQDGGEAATSQTAWLMGQPLGAWLVALAGLWIIGAGLAELYVAYSKDFQKDLRREIMHTNEVALATGIGRLGMTARGVVFGVTGGFLVVAALNADANRSRGLDGALDAVAGSPFGPSMLGVVALGLIAFGLYSALCARWMRVRSG